MKQVEKNLKTAQEQQSHWYNQKTREREFAPDDQVLILLPTTQNRLMAKWQGPYRVLKKVGKVNYLIDMHDRSKRRRVYHVNLLKKWETPVTDCFSVEAMEEDEDIPDWRDQQSGQPTFGEQLTEEQQKDIQQMLSDFPSVLQSKPGRTKLAKHVIKTGDRKSVV